MLIYGGSTIVAVLLARRRGVRVKREIARYFYPGEEETDTDAWTIISTRSYETFAIGMHRAFRVHPVQRVAEFL